MIAVRGSKSSLRNATLRDEVDDAEVNEFQGLSIARPGSRGIGNANSHRLAGATTKGGRFARTLVENKTGTFPAGMLYVDNRRSGGSLGGRAYRVCARWYFGNGDPEPPANGARGTD